MTVVEKSGRKMVIAEQQGGAEMRWDKKGENERRELQAGTLSPVEETR